jgi:hypothetical protein
MNQVSKARAGEGIRNVVLVHGGFVDGSGWQGVYDLLRKDGFNVSIVQNPTISLADAGGRRFHGRTPKFPGDSRRSTARSPNLRGGRSQVGTSSLPTTR